MISKNIFSIAPKLLLIGIFVLSVSLFASIQPTQAATYYWVGSGGNFSDSANWASSTGGAGGAGVPGASDTVIFDANSGSATLDQNVTLTKIQIEATYANTVTIADGVTSVTLTTGFSQAGGTFVFPSDVDPDVTTTNMTFSGSGTPFLISGGTFTHNNGNLTFTYSGGGQTLDVNGTQTLNNLTISLVSQFPLTIASADVVTVSGTLNITNGGVGASSGSKINLTGDLIVGAGADDGTGLVEVTGTNQSITLTGGGKVPNLTFSTASTTTATSTGTGVITFKDGMTVEAGTVDFSATTHDITVGTTGGFSISGGSFTSGTGTFTISQTFSSTGGTFTSGAGPMAMGAYAFTVNGGTVNLSSATSFDSGGSCVLSSGTFTAPGGDWNIGGSGTAFQIAAGGNFTQNSGAIIFDYQSGGATIDVQTPLSVNDLTINLNGFPLTIGTGATLTIGGDLSFLNGTLNGSGTVELQGDLLSTALGTTGTQPITFTGSNQQSITLAGADVGDFNADLTVNKTGGSVSLGADLTMNANNQDLIIAEGTFDLAGFALTVNGTGGTFVVQDGGNLQLQGGETPTVPTLNAGSTVTYDGTGTVTVKDWGYHHLAFDNASGTFNLGAAESLAGNLTITNGTFDISGFDLTVTGTVSNAGTLRLQGGETVSLTNDTDSGTVEYDGTGTYASLAAGNSYYHLTFNGTGGSWTQAANADVNGNLTITNGTLASSSYNINLAGDWSNSGTYTAGSGTVVLDGTAQTLAGSTTFNNLTKTTASATTLTLTAGQTFTVTGTATLQGASGNLLSLVSSSGGTQANFNPSGTRSFQYLSVTDNNNTSGTTITCLTGCTDGGNNTDWVFSLVVQFQTTTGSGAESASPGSFTITITPTYSSDISVDYAVTGGTATGSGTDYSFTGATATIPATEASVTVTPTFSVVDDSIDESNETVIITLSNPTGGASVGANSTFTYTITDNDTAGITVTESEGSTEATEGETDTYTVVLDTQPAANVTVTITADDQTESDTASITFSADGAGGTVLWSAQQTVTITATDDSEIEGEHTGTISHTASSGDGNYDGIAIDDVTMTITDNDSAGGGVVYYGEGSGSTVTVTPTTCTVTSPNGGESWLAGSTQDITWTSAGTGITNLNLYYKADGGIWTLIHAGTENDGTYNWTLPNISSEEVYLKAVCRDSGGGTLASDETDASFIIFGATEEPVEDPVTETPTEEPPLMTREEANEVLPEIAPVDSLVKLPNDGNPETQVDSAVYYIGLDGKRHPFPNGQIFFSWYRDFSLVKEIPATTLASIPLGDPVLSRPGTYWVKIQSDPKTYYVEPGYRLRWIEDEEAAVALGGENWNQQIIDVDPAYFLEFTIGVPLSINDLQTSWPNGALINDSVDSAIYLILNGIRREVGLTGLDVNHFQEKFIESNPSAEGWRTLPLGSDITTFEDELFSEMVI